jgi:hypothetical protein
MFQGGRQPGHVTVASGGPGGTPACGFRRPAGGTPPVAPEPSQNASKGLICRRPIGINDYHGFRWQL